MHHPLVANGKAQIQINWICEFAPIVFIIKSAESSVKHLFLLK